MKIALGIDIGGTNTKLALVDESGKTMDYLSFSTNADQKFEFFLKNLSLHVDKLLKNHSNIQLSGIGVGCPNVDARTGKLVSPPNLGWGNIDIQKAFEKTFKGPIFFGNDANVAALGEKIWGHGQKFTDFIVVTLGTGVGTGAFINNKLVIGGNGLATEGGHIITHDNGRKCLCGGEGHLECYASIRGIKQTVKELSGEDLKFREIAEMFKAGHPMAKQAFKLTAESLAKGLSIMGSLLAPEAFILSGGIATIGEDFLKDVKETYEKLVFPNFRKQTQIYISEIATEHGAVLGAAAQVFFHQTKF
ncbi:MAG: ROK family protein [Bacteriovoracaceae bacterium]|nr:ROK family protein [Bacteriovoracaceae bacterium]